MKKKQIKMIETKQQLAELIKSVVADFLSETGPSAQGIIQPFLGPSLPDDEGVPVRPAD
jgi:hypothetical protein